MTTQALTQILIVEDEPVFAEVLREIVLAEGGGCFVATVVGCLGDAKRHLLGGSCDLVLLDLTLPDRQGMETYREIHQAVPQLPVIVLSGLSDEAIALQTLRAGAQDYLMKNQFDGRLLGRSIRYAIERKGIELRLRESEEFFRLISENVTDLISVVDAEGRRLYSSPSYHSVLGCKTNLVGTDSFEEIHPEDRNGIRGVFSQVIASGQGRRAEYRFVREDGAVRHVESQSSVIRSESGAAPKVVVVSRDVTERMKSEAELRQALTELQQSHEQLKTAQKKLVQSEKLEAVSTFAAAVAHEVKNPLQTVVLGIDYLTDYVVTNDENAAGLLKQMGAAVHRADAIIRGLLEFSSHRKGAVSDQDLSELFRQSLGAVEGELTAKAIRLKTSLADDLPPLRLDKRSMKHVLINLLVTELRAFSQGGVLLVKTSMREMTKTEQRRLTSSDSETAKKGAVVTAEIESRYGESAEDRPTDSGLAGSVSAGDDFGIMVSRKIIELYGGKVDFHRGDAGSKFAISFFT